MKKSLKKFSLVRVIFLLALIGVVGLFGYWFWQVYSIKSFDECRKVLGSTLSSDTKVHTCITKFNKKFVQPLSDTENQALNRFQINLVQVALELYHAVHNRYPDSLEQLVPVELFKMPLDPLTDMPYAYKVKADKTDYTLTAEFSDGSIYTVSSPK